MNEKEIYENWKTTPQDFRGDMLKFQNWFDITDSVKSVVSQGHIDFHTKILTADVYKTLGDVRKKTCLEIGFGGGRLINAAACVFEKAIGIDIHNCFDMTENFLKDRSVDNYSLINYEDAHNIPDECVDFVYSFIVFQHFGSIDVFYSYLDLIKRVLKKGGCCNLHLGKNKWNDEDFYLKSDLSPKTANSTMFYKPDFVKAQLESRGFEVTNQGQTTKLPWVNDMSGQFFVTFTK